MTKPTPGPWQIDREHDEDEIAIVGKPVWGATRFGVKGEWDVCKIETDTPDTEANARLIAAAPDLLAALQAILADCGEAGIDGYVENSLYHTEVDAARAAIAKATSAASL